MRWYFKHVFAAQKVPVGICSEKMSLYLSAYRDEKKIEGEFTTEQWVDFGAYFSEKIELGGYKAKIKSNIEALLKARTSWEESPLETVAETPLSQVKQPAQVQKSPRKDYIPLALVGVLSNYP
jgi:hypothetical protein